MTTLGSERISTGPVPAGSIASVRRRPGTRARIQSTALERLTAKGYDQTSLREIAEQLGVTKAAVYYHFATKEELLASLLDQAVDEIDTLIEWMDAERSTRDRRFDLVDRLLALATGISGEVVRCMQVNEVALQRLGPVARLVNDFKTRLVKAAAPGDATVEERLRVQMAVTAVFTATQGGSDLGGTADDRAAAARRVAHALLP